MGGEQGWCLGGGGMKDKQSGREGREGGGGS